MKEEQKVIVCQIISIIKYFFDDRKMISCDEFYSSSDRLHSHSSIYISRWHGSARGRMVGTVVPVGRMFAPGKSREEGSFPEEQV
jgi:hypothetical protein